MGVWIEIQVYEEELESLVVTPYMGVWIEIFFRLTSMHLLQRHSLHGSVD